MTPELKARIFHFRDLAGFYCAPHAMPDLEAAWADLAELLFADIAEIVADVTALPVPVAEGQMDMFGEGWPI